jgi:uncharacterized protein (AIM24 family)
VNYTISGTVIQTVSIDLLPNETVFSQTNCMCWMNDAVEMNTNPGGGFLAGLARSFGGGSFFVTEFTARGTGHIAFAPRFPGTIMPIQLAPGERLLVHAGHVGAMTETIQFDIQMVRGFRNILFGGEGLFLATLTGPGHVALQSMPILNLAEEIGRYLPNRTETNTTTTAGPAGAVGGFLGGLFGNTNNR